MPLLRLLRCDLVHWVRRRARRAMVALHTCEVDINAHEVRKEGEDWADGWSAFAHGGRRGGGREGRRQIERRMDNERERDALSTMETTPRSGTYADAIMWTVFVVCNEVAGVGCRVILHDEHRSTMHMDVGTYWRAASGWYTRAARSTSARQRTLREGCRLLGISKVQSVDIVNATTSSLKKVQVSELSEAGRGA
jgi:hypothetical protein